jgi:hypothetical protein
MQSVCFCLIEESEGHSKFESFDPSHCHLLEDERIWLRGVQDS